MALALLVAVTVRNYLNDLYDINHKSNSETLVQSAADFGDNTINRNLIDALCKQKKWECAPPPLESATLA